MLLSDKNVLRKHASRKSFFKAKAKRSETEGSMLALFTKQKTLRLEDNVSEIATERLFSTPWAFVKEFTQQFKKCSTWHMSHHPTSSHGDLLIFVFLKAEIQSYRRVYEWAVSIFFSFEAFRACFRFNLLELEWFRTIASNLKSTGRHSWVKCTVLVYSDQTHYTTR